MSEKTTTLATEQDTAVKALGFWQKNSKLILSISTVVILAVGGFVGYKNFIQLPKERKAAEELFAAEAQFRKDSFALALNGNLTQAGFLKVIQKFSGTRSANLAQLYAGESFIQLGDFKKAVEHLEAFDAGAAKQVEAKKEGLLGDAYSELKKNEEAIKHYKKAGTTFPDDQALSSEYLFRGGLLAEMNAKTTEAIELYQIIKDKYPRTERGFVVDKYLARLGATK
jgi:predicted negative regulator of RcsB-dependent stress response